MRAALLSSLLLASVAPAFSSELRRIDLRESLTGTHVRYQQFVDGVEVVGAGAVVELDRSGREMARRSRIIAAVVAPEPTTTAAAAADMVRRRFPREQIRSVQRVAIARDGALEPAWRVTTKASSIERFDHYIHGKSLELIESIPLFYTGLPGRVFEANPVTVLNNASLQDQNDSAVAVPEGAYSSGDLPDLAPSGPLVGPNITIADLEQPATQRADSAQPLDFDRSHDAFEEVMAYYHLDRSQRYLQSLGFTGPRRIITRSLKVDAHGAAGADNSYYAIDATGEGILAFGDGGVDDAEDPDILLHEYGHAIHEAIAPSAFLGGFGSHGRALGEGFGDYWAFSSGYASSVAFGRDPFCVGDWDARCALASSTSCEYPPNADCLRRVDGSKTMDQFISGDVRGTEHRNGEIWSSALREIFMAMVSRDGTEEGRRNADRLIIESLFGMPPAPRFSTAAHRLVDADRTLYGGANAPVICAAMTNRKIFGPDECGGLKPRGEYTTFPASSAGDIPDNQLTPAVFTKQVNDDRLVDSVRVRVDIVHPYRGDLRVSLTSPTGTRVLLHNNSNDGGDDLRTTFGLETQSRESLDAFGGAPARGEWRLEISDVAAQDVGRLVSWDLLIRFQGVEPISVRPAPPGDAPALAMPIPASSTELRLLNAAAQEARVTLFFTPAGADGTTDFAAIVVAIAPGEVVRLSDVGATHFRFGGAGSVEVHGSTHLSLVGRAAGGITTQPLGRSVAAGTGVLHIHDLRVTSSHGTTLGIVELRGAAGIVDVTARNETGHVAFTATQAVTPFGHIEIPLRTSFRGRAELRVVSGDARVAAYALVQDGGSTDSVFIAAERSPSVAETRIVPAAIRGSGSRGTSWRTDVALSNLANVPQVARITSRQGSEERREVQLQPGASTVLTDVLQSIFGSSSAAGSLAVDGSVSDQLLVTSKTYAVVANGTASEQIPARPVSHASGQFDPAVAAIVFEQSERFRANIGVTETAGGAVTVRIRVFNAAGSAIATFDRQLTAHGHLQFSLAGAGVPQLPTGHVTFEVTAGFGRILGYTSSVDNQTGDSVYIPAR